MYEKLVIANQDKAIKTFVAGFLGPWLLNQKITQKYMLKKLVVALFIIIKTTVLLWTTAWAASSNATIPIIHIEHDKNQLNALKAAKNKNWNLAYELAKKSKYKDFTIKLLILSEILSGSGRLSMREINDFALKNKWLANIFGDEMERNLSVNTPSDSLMWFSHHMPLTAQSHFLMYDAQIKSSMIKPTEVSELSSKIKMLWLNNIFKNNIEEYFRVNYLSQMTQKEIKQKVKLLIWNERHELAKNLLEYLSAKDKTKVQLRIKALSNPSTIPDLFLQAKPSMQQDEFLQYLYIRYLLKNNFDKEGLQLLLKTTPKSHFIKWWAVKRIAIKNAIRDKQYKIAYQLCQQHNLESAQELAEANWYAGLIALKFLKQYKAATYYLEQYFNYSFTANSKSQGAYWLYMAYTESHDIQKASYWLKVAAKYHGNFYGQIALAKRYPKTEIDLFKSTPAIHYHTRKPALSTKDIQKMAVAAKVLFAAGYKKHAFSIIKEISESQLDRKTVDYISAHYINSLSYPLATTFAKYLVNNGHSLSKSSYPKHIKLNVRRNDYKDSFYYAIMRQESDFDQNAMSATGAVGLMQLMPETAKQCAKALSLNKNSYINNSQANAAMGCFYLDQMMQKFDGNYILTIAAYNAGIARVNKWITDYGDIRDYKSLTDVLGWIEMIPFNETKLYVKKIIENIIIYNTILYNKPHHDKALALYLGLKDCKF